MTTYRVVLANPNDPLRMLRSIYLAVKHNQELSAKTIESIKRNAPTIESVDPELVMNELAKMMQLGKLAPAIRLMASVGLLRYVMPEVEALRGVQQPKRFHAEGDVFEHTLAVLEHAKPTIEAQLAALLHDVGKPATQQFLEDKISFLGHEDVGAEIAEALLQRMKLDEATTAKVVTVVKNHMRAHSSLSWGPKAIRKFVREMGEYIEDVLDLTAADALGREMDEDVARRGDDYVQALRDRIKQTQDEAPAVKPILSGRDVMQVLGIPPGPEVGKAIQWLQNKADEMTERGQELTPELAKQLLAKEYKTAVYRVVLQ